MKPGFVSVAGVAFLTGFLLSADHASAQDCLGALITPARNAIGIRLEPQGSEEGSETLIGGEYLHVDRHLAWGLHARGIVEGFPPENPALGVGGTVSYVGLRPWFCPIAAVTRWSRESDFFAQVPGDSDQSTLLFRFGVGLAKVGGDTVRVAAWFQPHVTVARIHSRSGDVESTHQEAETFTDFGAGAGTVLGWWLIGYAS